MVVNYKKYNTPPQNIFEQIKTLGNGAGNLLPRFIVKFSRITPWGYN